MDDIISVSERETPDAARVILYPEGIFYKAYGYSAFRFIRHIRTYRAKKHFYKKLNGEICSIGFPKTVLAQLEADGWEVRQCENRMEVGGSFAPVDDADYRRWVDSVPLAEPKGRGTVPSVPAPEVPVPAHGPDAHAEGVLHSLREFAIENATPLECMMFLSELKRRLKP